MNLSLRKLFWIYFVIDFFVLENLIFQFKCKFIKWIASKAIKQKWGHLAFGALKYARSPAVRGARPSAPPLDPWVKMRLSTSAVSIKVINPSLIKTTTSFLAHLSTKCSGWAIVTGLCPSSFVRRASSVVRKLFYLNTFSSETTYCILTKLHRNDPWLVPYQSCSNGFDWLHM